VPGFHTTFSIACGVAAIPHESILIIWFIVKGEPITKDIVIVVGPEVILIVKLLFS
jgi:hypothetical protein